MSKAAAERILFLGYGHGETGLIDFLRHEGCTVEHTADPVTPDRIAGPDLVISFGYRHILRPPQIAAARRPIINLHISYLPYNRGAHPNFWAFYEGTPHGVSLHHIDAGVDTGDIVARRRVRFPDLTMTFRQTHARLLEEIEALFRECWPAIRTHDYAARPQIEAGTVHKMSDLPEFTGGWDRRICDVLEELRD